MAKTQVVCRRTAAGLSLLLAGFTGGCGGGGARAANDGGVNTGLASLAGGASPKAPPARTPEVREAPRDDNSLEHLAQQSAVNLQSVLDQLDRDAGAKAAASQAPQPASTPASLKIGPGAAGATGAPVADTHTAPPKPQVTAEAVKAPAPGPEVATPAPAQPPPAPAPEKPLAQRIDETAMSLVDLLRQQAVTGGDPRRTYLALAALEALRPGASQQVITPRSLASDPLTPDERAAVDGVREMVTSLTAAPSGKTFAASLRELADRVGMSQPVRLGAARLCARVSGYGRTTPLAAPRLLQGKPQRAIVYVELSSFGQRPVTESEATAADSPSLEGRPRFAVDVSQELRLYHDADGVLAWQQPEQRILETSTNRRRDFYLVQQVTLPENLTVGAYRLKVVVRDRTTGSQDEASIPIEVVADPSLASHGGD